MDSSLFHYPFLIYPSPYQHFMMDSLKEHVLLPPAS